MEAGKNIFGWLYKKSWREASLSFAAFLQNNDMNNRRLLKNGVKIGHSFKNADTIF